MVYAELGPGGGRIGPKHDVPEESNYARVRTEGTSCPFMLSVKKNSSKSFDFVLLLGKS